MFISVVHTSICLMIIGTHKIHGNTAPKLTNLPDSVSVEENSALGTTVFVTSATDVDGDSLRYSAAYTPTAGASLFIVDIDNGAVSLNTQLNYENLSPTVYDVEISCYDGTNTTSATLEVNVTDVDEAPSFSQFSYSTSVDEGPVTTPFLAPTFGVTDPEGAAINHTLDCAAYNTYFTMDVFTGQISYAQDYDVDASGIPASVSCTVMASDGTLSTSVGLTIYVNNINDNAPSFAVNTYTFLLEASDSVGTVIGYVTATDADIGVFGSFTYGVDTSTLADDYFGVTSTGQIYVKLPLTSYGGTGANFQFNATATDTGGLNDTAAITAVITMTTTVTTTTTTVVYMTFFDDVNSIVWFTMCMAGCCAMLVLAIVFMWKFRLCHKFPDLLDAVWPSCQAPVRRTTGGEK